MALSPLPSPCSPNSTNLALGGIPGSSSMIPTEAGIPFLGAPAEPGFITVTVMSTSSNSGWCVCPNTIISASRNDSCSDFGFGVPN